jgi:hypothetical protein
MSNCGAELAGLPLHPTPATCPSLSPRAVSFSKPTLSSSDPVLFLTATPVDVSTAFLTRDLGQRVLVDELFFAYVKVSAPTFFIHEHNACDCYCHPNAAVVVAQPDTTVVHCASSIPTSDNTATDVLPSEVVGPYCQAVCATMELPTIEAVSCFFHDQTW